jgi:hypothetical protein
MAKNRLAAVLATISPRSSIHDPTNRTVWLFDIDDRYSLEAVQRFFDTNPPLDGLRVRHEIARFRSIWHVLRLADKQRSPRPMTGWNGPFRLAGS